MLTGVADLGFLDRSDSKVIDGSYIVSEIGFIHCHVGSAIRTHRHFPRGRSVRGPFVLPALPALPRLF
jgi:hypothetical protein